MVFGIEDNFVAALEHHDRVCDINLYAQRSQVEKIVAVMQVSFPVLTSLRIWSSEILQVLPGDFLGGSAPSLQKLSLCAIPFPTLPTLLLSASDLVELDLWHIPPTGYISPEAIVVGLAALPRLQSFTISFSSQSVTSRPHRIPHPLATRTILPALKRFEYRGTSEYLEALVAHIEGTQLERIIIRYLNQLAEFRAVQLSQFFDRSPDSETIPVRHARVAFDGRSVSFTMQNYPYFLRQVEIICKGIDWQISHMAQVLSQISVTLSSVVHLQLKPMVAYRDIHIADTDDFEWFHLFHQFPTVRTLHIHRKLAGHVAPALEGTTGGMATEVLPSLELICIGGQCVKKFDAARRLSGRPIIVCTQEEFDKRLDSYVLK